MKMENRIKKKEKNQTKSIIHNSNITPPFKISPPEKLSLTFLSFTLSNFSPTFLNIYLQIFYIQIFYHPTQTKFLPYTSLVTYFFSTSYYLNLTSLFTAFSNFHFFLFSLVF